MLCWRLRKGAENGMVALMEQNIESKGMTLLERCNHSTLVTVNQGGECPISRASERRDKSKQFGKTAANGTLL